MMMKPQIELKQLLAILMFSSIVITLVVATKAYKPNEFTKALDKEHNCTQFTRPLPKQYRTIKKEIVSSLLVKKSSVLYRASEQWLESWGFSRFIDFKLKEAVKLFLTTKQMRADLQCGYCTFKLIYFNIKSTKALGHDQDRVSLMPRMIRRLAKTYARTCAVTLPEVYRDIEKKIDLDVTREVELISSRLAPLTFKDKDMTVHEAIEGSSWPLSVVAHSDKFLEEEEVADTLLDLMLELDKFTPDLKLASAISSPKIIKHKLAITLFKRYLFEPCDEYLLHFGGPVFFQADYIFSTIMKKSAEYEALLPKDMKSKLDFYPAWLNYRVCKTIMEKSADVAALILLKMSERQHQKVDINMSPSDTGKGQEIKKMFH